MDDAKTSRTDLGELARSWIETAQELKQANDCLNEAILNEQDAYCKAYRMYEEEKEVLDELKEKCREFFDDTTSTARKAQLTTKILSLCEESYG